MLGANVCMPTNSSRSMLEKAKRPGDLRRSTFSWCRSTRISASSAARDRKRPAKAHQISLQRSIIAARASTDFARAYQLTLVSGQDNALFMTTSVHLLVGNYAAANAQADELVAVAEEKKRPVVEGGRKDISG